MTVLKNSLLKTMSEQDLKSKMTEFRNELMKLRAQVSRGTPPESPGKLRALKRGIAKLLTALHAKKLGGAVQKNGSMQRM